MGNPISPFEKWRLETIPQVGFTPEIRELLAMAFEGGRKYAEENQEIGEAEIRQMLKEIEWCHQELEKQGKKS